MAISALPVFPDRSAWLPLPGPPRPGTVSQEAILDGQIHAARQAAANTRPTASSTAMRSS